MPTYEFKCDGCGLVTELRGTFEEVEKAGVVCPKCLDTAGRPMPMRRLITGGSGFILGGKGWPSQAGRRANADREIQRQRRKAFVMKARGEVPDAAIIKPKEADQLFDKRHTEGELDKLYKDAVEEGQ